MSTEMTMKRMTAEEFFDWVHRDENQPRHFELERGEVVEMSRPGELHCFVCGNVGFVLNAFARRLRKGYVLSNNPGVIVERDPDTVRGPDLAYFEKGKKYGDMNPKFTEGVPTLAVEVLSPDDHIGKITRRISEFLKSGVRLVWVIDPETCYVTVYRTGREPYTVEMGQEITGDDVIPDFRCAIAEFFLSPEEQSSETTP